MRENGFYWLKIIGNGWTIAQYEDNYWSVLGNDTEVKEEDLHT